MVFFTVFWTPPKRWRLSEHRVLPQNIWILQWFCVCRNLGNRVPWLRNLLGFPQVCTMFLLCFRVVTMPTTLSWPRRPFCPCNLDFDLRTRKCCPANLVLARILTLQMLSFDLADPDFDSGQENVVLSQHLFSERKRDSDFVLTWVKKMLPCQSWPGANIVLANPDFDLRTGKCGPGSRFAFRAKTRFWPCPALGQENVDLRPGKCLPGSSFISQRKHDSDIVLP